MMYKINLLDGSVEKEDNVHFSTKAAPIQIKEEISDFLDNVGKKLDSGIEKYTSKGSNWVVANIENISLRLVKYRLLRGAANNFQLPPELTLKQCVLNIETTNERCFKYAIIAALHHEEV